MSYSSIHRCVGDSAFQGRVSSCVAQEQSGHGSAPAPYLFVDPFCWVVASASDVEAAYAFAILSENPNPGGDPTVITDGMILTNVQAHWEEVVGR